MSRAGYRRVVGLVGVSELPPLSEHLAFVG